MFNKMKLQTKIYAVVALVLVAMSVIGFVGISSTKNLGNIVENAYQTRVPSIDLILQADRDLQQALVAERSVVFSAVESPRFAQFVKEFEENVEQAEQRMKKYSEIAGSGDNEAKIKQFWA